MTADDFLDSSDLVSLRADVMAPLSNPETKALTMQMLDTEGGGVATMEALVNRTAMIRQKIPDWTLSDELTSGFYGPINRGYAQTLRLHPKSIRQYESDIEAVRNGSNVIQGRTDQGSLNDPNVNGPGRVPGFGGEVYNFWKGRRRGQEFSHTDAAQFANYVTGLAGPIGEEGHSGTSSMSADEFLGSDSQQQQTSTQTADSFLDSPAPSPEPPAEKPPATVDIGPPRQETPRQVGFLEGAYRGAKGELLGLSQAVSKHVYAPVFHGIQEAISTIAPDSDISKAAQSLYSEFNQQFADEGSTTGKMRKKFAPGQPGEIEGFTAQLGRALGGIAPDIGSAVFTGGATRAIAAAPAAEQLAPTVFNIVKQMLPTMGRSASTFAIPALRSAMDAQNQAAAAGADTAGQNWAFTKAGLGTMASAAIPLGVESGAHNMLLRALSRATKTVPLSIALSESQRGIGNVFLPPSQQQPFDAQQLAINSIPIVLMAAALGTRVPQERQGPISTEAITPERPPPIVDNPTQAQPAAVPESPPPIPPALKPPPLPPPGKNLRITPLLGPLRKAKGEEIVVRGLRSDPTRLYEGQADILHKFGFTRLAQAVRNHVDQARAYTGLTASPFRKWAKGVSRVEMKTVAQESYDYFKMLDGKGVEAAKPLYDASSPATKSFIDTTKEIFKTVGEISRERGLQVFDPRLYSKEVAAYYRQIDAKRADGLERLELNRVKALEKSGAKTVEQYGIRIDNAKTLNERNALIKDAEALAKERTLAIERLYESRRNRIEMQYRLEREYANARAPELNEGGWRPMGNLGEKFFPRRISQRWLQIMRNPAEFPEEYARLKEQMIAEGHDPAKIDRYVESAVQGYSNMPDTMSSIEHARVTPLPTMVYDYGFDTIKGYLRNWSEDMAFIEAFGQKGPTGKNLFDEAQRDAGDNYTKGYIKNIEFQATGMQNNSLWPLELATAFSTGSQLGNFRSSARNLIGGINYNLAFNGIWRGSKSVFQMRKSFQAINDAYEKGILQDNLSNIQENIDTMQPFTRKFANLALKTSGYNKVEEITRAMNFVAAKEFLRSAIKANQTNPMSSTALRARAAVQRLGGIDPERLFQEGGTGPLTDRFLRQNVAEIQGGYRYDQTPYFINTQAGKALFQYQKWSTQATRAFIHNTLNPALQAISGGHVGAKETVQVPDGAGGFRTAKVPGSIIPLARYLLLSTTIGLGQKELEHLILGIPDREASFAEILSRMEKGDAKSLDLLVHKLFMANVAVGSAGLISNYLQAGMDITQRSRFKTPFDPPSLAILQGASGLFMDAITQGNLTGRDIDAFLRTQFSAYRVGQQAASQMQDAFGGDFVALKAQSARNDLAWLRGVTRRYDDVIGTQRNVTSAGQMGKSPLTPFYSDIKEALMTGDSLRAMMILDEQFKGMPKAKRDIAMDSLRQSVRMSQPIRVGGGSGEAMRSNFLDWAKEYLPPVEVVRIMEIDDRYRRTAIGLHLLNPRDIDVDERKKALQNVQMRNAYKAGK